MKFIWLTFQMKVVSHMVCVFSANFLLCALLVCSCLISIHPGGLPGWRHSHMSLNQQLQLHLVVMVELWNVFSLKINKLSWYSTLSLKNNNRRLCKILASNKWWQLKVKCRKFNDCTKLYSDWLKVQYVIVWMSPVSEVQKAPPRLLDLWICHSIEYSNY